MGTSGTVKRVSWGRVALSGLVIGVLAGVVFGLIGGDLWSGVASGVIYGIGLPLIMLMGRRSSAMDDLAPRQRREVMRKLRNGEAAADPELAPALIEQGTEILETPFTPKVAGIAAGVMFVFGVTGLVVAVAKAGVLAGLAVGLPLIILSLPLLYTVVSRSGRRRELVAESLRATEQSVHKG